MTISVDGCPEAKRAYAVAFVNAPVYGGPLELRVDVVNMKDRKLGLVVVEDMGVRTALLGALSLLRKHRLRVPGVESLPCSEGRIETAMELPVTVDGEICIRTPIDVHILPSALAVFVPAQRDVPTESISQAQSDRRPGTESRRAAG